MAAIQSTFTVEPDVLKQILTLGEQGYPEEVAAFLLGQAEGERVVIEAAMPVENRRQGEARLQRYELTGADWMSAEEEASRCNRNVVGIFHSHPDHPARPSTFDLDHAFPNLIYLIASIMQGKAAGIQAWVLKDHRGQFQEQLFEER